MILLCIGLVIGAASGGALVALTAAARAAARAHGHARETTELRAMLTYREDTIKRVAAENEWLRLKDQRRANA